MDHHCGRIAKELDQRKKTFPSLAQFLHHLVQEWVVKSNVFVAAVAFRATQSTTLEKNAVVIDKFIKIAVDREEVRGTKSQGH